MLIPFPHENPSIVIGVDLGDGQVSSERASEDHAPLESGGRKEEPPETID